MEEDWGSTGVMIPVLLLQRFLGVLSYLITVEFNSACRACISVANSVVTMGVATTKRHVLLRTWVRP